MDEGLAKIVVILIIILAIIVLASMAGVDFDALMGLFPHDCAGNCGAPIIAPGTGW